MELEPPRPLSAINDDPVFNTRAAATIIGVSYEQMKKWRQRGQGPRYYQYGEDGPVRYPPECIESVHGRSPRRNREGRSIGGYPVAKAPSGDLVTVFAMASGIENLPGPLSSFNCCFSVQLLVLGTGFVDR